MYIAADIGGTTGRVAAYESLASLQPLEVTEFKMTKHSAATPGNVVTDLNNFIIACRELAKAFGTIHGVGLAVAGKVNPDRSGLVLAGNIGHWVGEPIVQYLRQELSCPVVLGNDAEAAALAESVFGVGSGPDFQGANLLGMIWGTGVGGACVYYGPDHVVTIPAEPGHIRISLEQQVVCGCGEYGHLEAYCGGANIPARWGKPAEELNADEWKEIMRYMIFGLENVLLVHPVTLVTFSGGIACKQSWILNHLEAWFDQPKFGSPRFRISAFGESAGTLGALSLLSL